MSSKAHFENIQNYIINELDKASKSIYIAVAWFTDPVLLFRLEELAKSSVEIVIILMDDDINKGIYGLNFDVLVKHGGKVLFICNQENKRTLMHNKFCIIDNSILITGSYNWSRNAQNNHENIVIIRDNIELVKEFTVEFNSLIKTYDNTQLLKIFPLDYRKISIRLVSVKNAILLEDDEDVRSQTQRLNNLMPSVSDEEKFYDLKEITNALTNRDYSLGIDLVESFLSNLMQVIHYVSPEIAALKLEEKELKNQIVFLESEKLELTKIVRLYELKHDDLLGVLILKILKIQKENAGSNTFGKAEKDYNSYKKSYDINKNQKINDLDEQDLITLKKLFRQAAILCHPDKVQDEFQKDASETYVELTKAYERNNLEKVKVLLDSLENGRIKLKNVKNEAADEVKVIKSNISYLKLKRNDLTADIVSIKSSKTYQTISIIDNWDDYLLRQKEKLELQLELLEMEKNG